MLSDLAQMCNFSKRFKKFGLIWDCGVRTDYHLPTDSYQTFTADSPKFPERYGSVAPGWQLYRGGPTISSAWKSGLVRRKRLQRICGYGPKEDLRHVKGLHVHDIQNLAADVAVARGSSPGE